MKDLTLDKSYAQKSRGQKVRLIQEWLSLHGLGLVADGDYGPATDFAVRRFQAAQNLAENGVVDQATFAALVAPMQSVLNELVPQGSLGSMVVAYAEQHLARAPREIGGQNRGPWVRLYMNGHEGESWPWCAGFASFVLKQACKTLGVQAPITTSFSCDSLAASAKGKRLFLAEKTLDRQQIRPGMFFLNRRTPSDWTHVGIVIEAAAEVFMTIEGNTNDEGSREGYEVCRRIRGYKGKDFISI